MTIYLLFTKGDLKGVFSEESQFFYDQVLSHQIGEVGGEHIQIVEVEDGSFLGDKYTVDGIEFEFTEETLSPISIDQQCKRRLGGLK